MTRNDARTTASTLVDANLFQVDGPIRINYSSSSINGQPHVSYTDAEFDLSFQGDDITRIDTPWAELVTVTLQNLPDAFIRAFTLFVPTIRVSPGGEAEFDTLGIETTDRSSSFVPSPGPAGVLQNYRVHQLHGNAHQVDF